MGVNFDLVDAPVPDSERSWGLPPTPEHETHWTLEDRL
jgi:hypothetical protein